MSSKEHSVSPSHSYLLFEYMKNTKSTTIFVALTAENLTFKSLCQIHFYILHYFTFLKFYNLEIIF